MKMRGIGSLAPGPVLPCVHGEWTKWISSSTSSLPLLIPSPPVVRILVVYCGKESLILDSSLRHEYSVSQKSRIDWRYCVVMPFSSFQLRFRVGRRVISSLRRKKSSSESGIDICRCQSTCIVGHYLACNIEPLVLQITCE